MKEENKKSKKKVLLYYLILAACLLVIAAVTVTVVFTVGRNNPIDNVIDNEQNGDGDDGNGDNTGDNNDPDDGNGDDTSDNNDPDDGNDKPTTSVTGYTLPVKTAAVTLGYEFAYDVTLDRYCVHQGMDFEAKAGDSVYAVLDGTVSSIEKNSLIGENFVTITHSNGVVSTYKYVNASDDLTVGKTVKQGDIIGAIAEAGGMEMNQGEHLHFVITVNGKTADPDVYLNVTGK